jgi:hypothetical protein
MPVKQISADQVPDIQMDFNQMLAGPMFFWPKGAEPIKSPTFLAE